MKNYATNLGNGVDSALSHSERARQQNIRAWDGERMKTDSQKISPMRFICARRTGARGRAAERDAAEYYESYYVQIIIQMVMIEYKECLSNDSLELSCLVLFFAMMSSVSVFRLLPSPYARNVCSNSAKLPCPCSQYRYTWYRFNYIGCDVSKWLCP